MEKDQLQSQQVNRYKYIIENVKDVIWELNSNFIFTFVSPNSREMCGYETEELIGNKLTDFLTEQSRNYLHEQIVLFMNQRSNMDAEKLTLLHEVQFVCKDGSPKWVEVTAKRLFYNGKFVGYIGTTRDVSEKKEYEYQLNKYIGELKKLNAKLKKTATTDILTGAFNRRKFEDDVSMLIRKNEKKDVEFSLIFFDIDHFKSVNDLFGHKTGDIVLQRISELVLKNIRRGDRLFRWGGEEFIIVLPKSDLEIAKIVAGKIRNLIQDKDFGVGRKITVSLGVCEYKANENIDQIVSRLDNILYQAKMQGRNTVVY